jgi:hypothetical protein
MKIIDFIKRDLLNKNRKVLAEIIDDGIHESIIRLCTDMEDEDFCHWFDINSIDFTEVKMEYPFNKKRYKVNIKIFKDSDSNYMNEAITLTDTEFLNIIIK